MMSDVMARSTGKKTMAAEELGRSFLKKKERRTKKQNVSFIFIKGTLKQASMNESISFFFFFASSFLCATSYRCVWTALTS